MEQKETETGMTSQVTSKATVIRFAAVGHTKL